MSIFTSHQTAFRHAPASATAGTYLTAALQCEAEDTIDDDAFLDAISEVARFLAPPPRDEHANDDKFACETAADLDHDGGEACRQCGASPGDPDYGTVGDGFDGLCPICADKAEQALTTQPESSEDPRVPFCPAVIGVILEGGVVAAIVTHRPGAVGQIVIIDYDVEGSDLGDLTGVPQSRGEPDAVAIVSCTKATEAAFDLAQIMQRVEA